jgi:hypothetical protein
MSTTRRVAAIQRADCVVMVASFDVCFWQILLQKSQKARRLIFRQRTKQATIADQCRLKPVIGIACEFGARRRSPPHYYSIVAPMARRI